MSKYKEDVIKLLEYIGGRENIAAVTHCATRLRFVLSDNDKTNLEKIKDLPSVKGSFTQAGQFQIIIGNDVATFYKELVACTGIETQSKEAVKEAAKKNMNLFQRIIANLSQIFAPLIPAIVVGGLILGLRSLIGDIKFFENGTMSLADMYVVFNGIYKFLWLIGEAVFHFLPVGVVWSVTKKMGANQMLGIVLGITLVSPQLLNAYELATAANIPVWDFGAFQIQMIGYQSQVIPAILIGFTFVFLERLFTKITPDAIKMIVVPFCSLVPSVFLAHAILGPIGRLIGTGITTAVNFGFQSSAGFLVAGVFGMLYPVLVLTGLHHTILALDLQLISDIGGTYVWPIIALCNISQGSAVLSYYLMHRKDEKEKQVSVPAFISAYLGVTEPAIFGINLKYFYPFVGGLIGSGVAGVISMSFNCMANSVGVGGLPAILSMKIESMGPYLIAMAAAVIIPLIVTPILMKTPLSNFKTR